MRLSALFGKTLRQVPSEAETPSHRLLLRAGMVAPLVAGIYSHLPLGRAVLRKIEGIIREEMDREGGQEITMPSLLPIEVYQASGRDQSMADILFRVKDHRDRDFVLGPTHEEVTVELFKRNVRSYRDLPVLIYQIASKFRDEPRPRGGLIRLRQFTMKDLYSFDADSEGLDVSYRKMFRAYQRIFDRCSVATVPVLADSGAMGGKDTHEFIYLTEFGEDSCLLCPNCEYAANAEVAEFVKEPAHAEEEAKPLQEIDTPGLYTISALAEHLGVPESRTCKAVFYSAAFAADGSGNKEQGTTVQPVFVAIRGDMDVNEAKLRNVLGAVELRYMDEAEATKAGFEAGSASAVGLPTGAGDEEQGTARVRVVADELVTQERNLVAGANKPDKHLLNVNYDRDWEADIVADIALAKEGYRCAKCGTPMDLRRGIEMGQVFKLGTRYSEMMGATFLDREGKPQPVVMGSYGIGTERLLAAVVEANHDEAGIVWPRSLAPYDVHMVAIQPDKPDVREVAERLYEELGDSGIPVLYDDRDETPGVKFNDADLLGMPLRVTVSPRNLEKGVVELKGRTDAESRTAAIEDAVGAVREALSSPANG
ncbi:MAG: proline--tRNA ligase [Chloroflexi bacterium]|nr:MAG: proline--tRNA ligase [Chloroflexota bacterium]